MYGVLEARGLKPGSHWLLLLILMWLTGCTTLTSSYHDADQNLPMKLGRIQVLEQNGVTVHVRIPTDDKASDYFGVPLSDYGIQPIWMRIKNASDVDFWLMPIAVDPDYYSADKAAMATAVHLFKADRMAYRQRFRAKALSFFTPARSIQQGYIYASYKRGGQFVDVRLSGHKKAVRMRFTVLLPTESFDYEYSELHGTMHA